MSKHAFGLDISDSSIEALEIKKKFNKLSIEAYGRVELEPGIVANGRILHKERLVEVLVNLVKSGVFSSKNVVVSVPESKTFIHIFQLPIVISEDNISESIQYAAEETIPLAYDKSCHDYQIIHKDKQQQEVLYVASFKEVIDEYKWVLAKAGLTPVVFETESLSLIRSLVQDDIFEGALIADIGARTTIITIYDHHGVRFSKNIDIAGNKFTERISRSLKIDFESAEKLKKEKGFSVAKEKSKIISSFQSNAKSIVSEIEKAIIYYQKRTGFVVNKVIFCGGSSMMPGLAEYMQSLLKLKVERGDPLSQLRYNSKIFKSDQAVLYSTAVGLALRGVDKSSIEEGINLLKFHDSRAKVIPAKKIKKVKAKKIKKVAEEIDSQEQISKPSSEKRRLKILAVIFGILVIAFAGIFFWQRTHDEPLIKIVDTPTNFPINQPSGIVSSVDLDIMLLVHTVFADSLPDQAIAGRSVKKAISKSTEIETTGVKTVDRPVSATIKIINNYSSDQPLVATTRFLTSAGILFRLDEGVVVPAQGQIEAGVSLDYEGDIGTIRSSARLSIPGLSPSLQEVIYGETISEISSGEQTVRYVLETDIAAAIEAVTIQFNDIDSTNYSEDIQDGEVVVPYPLIISTGEFDTSHEIGNEAERLTITMEGEVDALIIIQEAVKQKLNKQLETRLPSDLSPEDFIITDWTYQLDEFNQETGVAVLRITGVAVAQ